MLTPCLAVKAFTARMPNDSYFTSSIVCRTIEVMSQVPTYAESYLNIGELSSHRRGASTSIVLII